MNSFCKGTLVAAIVSAVNLELEAGAELEALVEQEHMSEISMEPCPFPQVTQFNTPEYLAQSASCKKRQIW